MKTSVIKNPVLSCSVAVTLLCVVLSLVTEKIEKNDGLGFDGVSYASIVKKCEEILSRSNPHLEIYMMQMYGIRRIFVPTVVHYIMKVLRLEYSNRNIILTFQWFNLFLIAISAVAWGKIINGTITHDTAKILSFVFLFCNYAILKMNSYYVVLLDMTAFLLCILSLYCYLNNSQVGLLLLAIISAFTWPTMFYNIVILFLFPKKFNVVKDTKFNVIRIVVPLIMTALFIAEAIYIILIRKFSQIKEPVNMKLLPVSIAVAAIYLFFSYLYLLRNVSFNNIAYLLRKDTVVRFFILIVIYFVLNKIYALYHTRLPEDRLLRVLIVSSVLQPLIFMLAHIIYFGPVMLFPLIYYKEYFRIIHNYGIGMVLLFFLNIPFILMSESRCITNFFPVITFFAALLVDKFKMSYTQVLLFSLLSLFASKFWMDINGSVDLELYYMNFGPWMTFKWYLIQGILVLLTAGYILYVKRYTYFKPLMS